MVAGCHCAMIILGPFLSMQRDSSASAMVTLIQLCRGLWGRGSYDLLMGDELALSTVTWRDYPGMQPPLATEIDDVAEFLSFLLFTLMGSKIGRRTFPDLQKSKHARLPYAIRVSGL